MQIQITKEAFDAMHDRRSAHISSASLRVIEARKALRSALQEQMAVFQGHELAARIKATELEFVMSPD